MVSINEDFDDENKNIGKIVVANSDNMIRNVEQAITDTQCNCWINSLTKTKIDSMDPDVYAALNDFGLTQRSLPEGFYESEKEINWCRNPLELELNGIHSHICVDWLQDVLNR